MKLFAKESKRPKVPGRKDFEQLAPAERVITFYSEDGASWPHFAPIVEQLTRAHGETINYLTSSASDPILTTSRAGVRAFFVGEGVKRAFFFQTMETGVLVATVPQLGISVLPRSRLAATLGTRYVYVFHSMVSTHMIYEPDGFDHYDTVMCVGPYMVEEIRRREALAGLAAKELVEHGSSRLDAILAVRESMDQPILEQPTVLIAPSWGPTCIFETVGVEVIRTLLTAGCRVIARPHPMTTKKTPGTVERIAATFGSDPNFTLDDDIVAATSLLQSAVMVSDWSGAALEYAFGLERPVIFLDVDRKVNNPSYPELDIVPFEVSVRDQIGVVVAPDQLDQLGQAVHDLVASAGDWRERIRVVRDAHVFNVGRSAEFAASHLAAAADAFRASRGVR